MEEIEEAEALLARVEGRRGLTDRALQCCREVLAGDDGYDDGYDEPDLW